MSDSNSTNGSDLVPMNDGNALAQAVVNWHSRKVAMLRHMQDIPPGTEVTYPGVNEDMPLKLEGDMLEGFKLGLTLSLMELGTLPFEVEYDEEDEAAPQAPTTPIN